MKLAEKVLSKVTKEEVISEEETSAVDVAKIAEMMGGAGSTDLAKIGEAMVDAMDGNMDEENDAYPTPASDDDKAMMEKAKKKLKESCGLLHEMKDKKKK